MMFTYDWDRFPVTAGRTEYGLPRIQYLHFIVATASDGSRYAHYHGEVSDDPVVCPPATARILRKIQDSEPDPRFSDFWEPTNPVEGSPAHLLEADEDGPLPPDDEAPFGLFGNADCPSMN
jgi:hypothetical protein